MVAAVQPDAGAPMSTGAEPAAEAPAKQTDAGAPNSTGAEPAAEAPAKQTDAGAPISKGTESAAEAPAKQTEAGAPISTGAEPAAEAPAKQTDAGAPISKGAGPVTIAGQNFANREAVNAHVRTVQEALSDGQHLPSEDSLFMFHLASFLPDFEGKLTAPVVGFKYGSVLTGFFMLRSDGSEENISVKKCLDALYATVATKAGAKRPREAEGPVKEEVPAVKKAFKMRPGCVLLISGIPSNLPYKIVRTKLDSMGDCRFVELLGGKKPKKKAKGKGKEKGKGKGKAEVEEDEEDSDDGTGPPLSARARFADPDLAANVAKELKQINGHVVTARILEGDEEKDFWENLLERADQKRGAEAKGKKGKGKAK